MPPHDLGNNKPTASDVKAAKAAHDAAVAAYAAASAALQTAASAMRATNAAYGLLLVAHGSDQ